MAGFTTSAARGAAAANQCAASSRPSAQRRLNGCPAGGAARSGASVRLALRATHNAWLPISLHSARMASRRALDLRHTAPMVRVGTGLTKGLIVTPRALP